MVPIIVSDPPEELVRTRWQGAALAAWAAAMTVTAGCAADSPTTTPTPSAPAPASATASAAASAKPAGAKLAPLPACRTLTSVVRRHFPGAVMGVEQPRQVTRGLGIRGNCTAKTELDDGAPLMIHMQLLRLEPAADGTSAEQRGFDGLQPFLQSSCGSSLLIDGGRRLPHTWSCTGSSDEILPQAGATALGDEIILSLISSAVPGPGRLEALTGTAAQLAYDLVDEVSQTR